MSIPLSGLKSLLARQLSVHADAGVVAATLVTWQALRIPAKGSAASSIAHAHEWLSLNRSLGLAGLQSSVISLVNRPVLIDVARWSYKNLHVFAIFTFMVALRAAAPDRYPRVRAAFVLLHVPALIAIAAFPLAPPQWLPHPPAWSGGVPALHGSLFTDLRNQTAAVASEHFGYAALIAAGTLWSARWRPKAWTVMAYPAYVFVVIVGTGHHYPLDVVVGAACVAFGFAVAGALEGPVTQRPELALPVKRWAPLAVGYGLLAGWADAVVSGRLHLQHPSLLTPAALFGAAAAFVAQTRAT